MEMSPELKEAVNWFNTLSKQERIDTIKKYCEDNKISFLTWNVKDLINIFANKK